MERKLSGERRVHENHTQAPIVSVEKPNVPVEKVDPDIEKMHRTGRIPRSMQYFKTDAF